MPRVTEAGKPDKYGLVCQGCGARFPAGRWVVNCPQCQNRSLLRTDYTEPLRLNDADERFCSYAAWLPYDNKLNIEGPRLATIEAPELGAKIGLERLWLLMSGYSTRHGSLSETGTFKECEAVGVLSRVHEQTNKTLIVSSAGNAGRAFLEWGNKLGLPVVVVLPESARTKLRNVPEGKSAPLLILVKDAQYPDAMQFVDSAVQRFPDRLVREGGCFNVARRDSMSVPFLNAARTIGRLPDWYVQAVGSGTGAIGAWEAALRLQGAGLVPQDRKMRLLLVQNAPFAPMVEAWEAGQKQVAPMSQEDVRARLGQVMARVLSNATPPYAVRGGVYDCLSESHGQMIAVPNSAISRAQQLVKSCLDFTPCEAASAACAGLIEAVQTGRVGRTDEVLLHLTGGGFNEIPDVRYEPEAVEIAAADHALGFSAIERYLTT